MFRLLLLLFIALRAIACPVCCAMEGFQAEGDEAAVTHSCSCSKSQGEPCGESELPPVDSSCPCDGGCEFQITPETHLWELVDVQSELAFAPLSFVTLDLSETFIARFEEHPRRLDLPTGRSVRIAHASLLI